MSNILIFDVKLFLLQVWKRWLITSIMMATVIGALDYMHSTHRDVIHIILDGTSLFELEHGMFQFPIFWFVYFFLPIIVLNDSFCKFSLNVASVLVLGYSRVKIIAIRIFNLFLFAVLYNIFFGLVFLCFTKYTFKSIMMIIFLLICVTFFLLLLYLCVATFYRPIIGMLGLTVYLVITTKLYVNFNPLNIAMLTRITSIYQYIFLSCSAFVLMIVFFCIFLNKDLLEGDRKND